MQDKTSDILIRYIHLCGYKLDSKEIDYQVKGSPYYPSLRSLTGVLDHFSIEHVAAQVDVSLEVLEQLPLSFIAHTRNDRFMLVIVEGKRVSAIFDDGKRVKLSFQRFLELWDGVILVMDSKPRGKDLSLSGIQKFALPLMAVLGTLLIAWQNASIYSVALVVLTLLGGMISYLIVTHEQGRGGRLVDAVCSGDGKHVSCDDVLRSKGAKVLGRFGLGQVGLSYFLMLAAAWGLSTFYSASIVTVKQLMLAALPFTLYSIVYQTFILRKWCVLCLSIVATIWLMGVSIFIDSGSELLRIQPKDVIVMAGLFSLLMWVLDGWIKHVKVKDDFDELRAATKRFKQNPKIYNALVDDVEPAYTTVDCPEIVLGKSKAGIELVVITSPLCGFCKEVHTLVAQILEANSPIKVIIRFNIKDIEGLGAQLCSRMLDIYHDQGAEACEEAMNDAYLHLTPEQWLKKYGVASGRYKPAIAEARRWCEQHKISFTPELLINGKPFPKEYDRADLPIVIEALAESLELVPAEA